MKRNELNEPEILPALRRGQPAFRFLDLPAEIRNKIYEHASRDAIGGSYVLPDRFVRLRRLPNITLTSHQLRRESLSVFFDNHTLYIYQYWHDRIRKWLDSEHCPIMIPRVRFLRLEDYQYYNGADEGRGKHRYNCNSAFEIDLKQNETPVSHRRDPMCIDCPVSAGIQVNVERVNTAIETLKRVDGYWRLTREGLKRILNAAAW